MQAKAICEVIDRDSEEWQNMKIKPFSPNQLRALALSTAPFNLWDGSIRSGKTFLSIAWIINMNGILPKGDGMFLGMTPETMERNFLNDLMETVGEGNYHYRTGKTIDLYYYDNHGARHKRRWHIVGASDIKAKKRIRGSTLMIAVIDEGSLIPQEVFDELVGRLTSKDAKCLVTTNPDSPNHWLLKDYVENPEAKKDWRRFKFLLEDNLALDPEYIKRIKRQYKGIPARYQRMILGRWVVAEGVIYQVFDEQKHVVKKLPTTKPSRLFVGCDYGVENPTCFLLIGEYTGMNGHKYYVVLKEYYYSGRESKKTKTTSEFAEDFVKFLDGTRITEVVIDPSAKALITELKQPKYQREAGVFWTIKPANNEVLTGIEFVANLIRADRLFVHESCKSLIKEFGIYAWNPKAQMQGQDAPIKEHDHALDALRYALYTLFRKTINGMVSSKNAS